MPAKSRFRPFLRRTSRPLALLGILGLGAGAQAAEAQAPAGLEQRIAEESRRLDELKGQLARMEAELNRLRRLVGQKTSFDDAMEAARGAGAADPGPDTGTPINVQGSPPVRRVDLTQDGPPPVPAPKPAPRPAADAPPRKDSQPPQVAPIFEQPGVLTPRGKYVLEPSLQYAYASSDRVALVGYTIIPAIVIGLIDVREVKRNTATAALTARYGLTNRFEIEAKLPWAWRSDDTIQRPLGSGAATESLFGATGKGIGDVEFTGRYQLNDGGDNKPYFVGTLRFKTRTGKDPFEVVTATTVPGGQTNSLQRELPTGSGFYTLQPGLTALFASDPAVFFGSVSYQYSFKRKNVMMNTDTGPINLGDVQPGGVFGFNFGMGLALNDKASFSIGYDHASVGRTKQNGVVAPNAVVTQLGTLLMGFSYRLTPRTSLNLSVGMGVTRDAPDVQLSLRLPMTF